MAEPPIDPTQPSTTFPDPPPFWRDFTPDKVDRMDSLRRRYADQTGLEISTIGRVSNVPEDLVNLQPPAEPVDGTWRLYGESLKVSGAWLFHFGLGVSAEYLTAGISSTMNLKALRQAVLSAWSPPKRTLMVNMSTVHLSSSGLPSRCSSTSSSGWA